MSKKHKPENEQENESAQPELLTHPDYETVLQKLSEEEQKSNQYWERILRMQAETDNLSRRAERDVANAHKYALEKFVAELLPIVDSLESCITNVPKEIQAKAGSVIEGVHLTLKMFYNAMEKFGIVQVNPVGQPFNPEFEQAISMHYDPDVAPGHVISVLQKGYTLNNRLIRPALVVVGGSEENR